MCLIWGANDILPFFPITYHYYIPMQLCIFITIFIVPLTQSLNDRIINFINDYVRNDRGLFILFMVRFNIDQILFQNIFSMTSIRKWKQAWRTKQKSCFRFVNQTTVYSRLMLLSRSGCLQSLLWKSFLYFGRRSNLIWFTFWTFWCDLKSLTYKVNSCIKLH